MYSWIYGWFHGFSFGSNCIGRILSSLILVVVYVVLLGLGVFETISSSFGKVVSSVCGVLEAIRAKFHVSELLLVIISSKRVVGI